MNEFQIGEKAWHCEWGMVTIASQLLRENVLSTTTGATTARLVYRVDRHDGVPMIGGLPWCAMPGQLRKLDHKPGDMAEVQRLTGWVPRSTKA